MHMGIFVFTIDMIRRASLSFIYTYIHMNIYTMLLCIFNSLSPHPIYHVCLHVMLCCVRVRVRVCKRANFNDKCDIGELFFRKNPFCAGLIYKRPMSHVSSCWRLCGVLQYDTECCSL